ncbi:Methyltransferase type 11 [Thiorhodococcus drewsii AZ1]|uniref:Methyltransferase type 11 n=1 Tax=Thiorhodococcus drewsii AZ1 TaxID=765913 RepID=G2E380_9GAMM|nr:methyltransferase domain-containing protein [Thiorhodococcus drewsii]EGV30542.1 Methyltransferase type 11 [Thiorhodococcus drewsii AZ1]
MSDSGLVWLDQFADLPFAQPFLAQWQEKKSAEPIWLAYEQALDSYLSLQKDMQFVADNYRRLQVCRDDLEKIYALGDVPVSTRLLLGRVYFQLGLYRSVVGCLEPLTQIELRPENAPSVLNWPFLPPLADYDHRSVAQGDISQWLNAALLETLELCSGGTSYIDTESHLPRLSRIKQNPNCSFFMETRLALCAMRLGKSISFGADSQFLHSDNPNHEVWRELSSRVSAANRKSNLLSRPLPTPPRVTTPLEFPIADLQYLPCRSNRSFVIDCDDGKILEVLPLGYTDYALFGRSSDQRWFVKIELEPHPLKRNNLLQEAEIIRELNRLGCISCPTLHGVGSVQSSTLVDVCRLPKGASETLPALLLPYLSSQPAVGLQDLLFTMEEQRKLGWFHADLKPDNIRLCPETQVCYLIDYDQAEPLEQPQIEMPLLDFLRWADDRVRAKYSRFKFNGLFNYFPGIRLEQDILSRLDQGRIDIGQTTLFRSAETTLNPSKIYHTIDLPNIVAHGERTLEARMRLMDLVRFFPGERVLDVGCNSGLLCAYLASRECEVKGIDLDPCVIRGAKMLSNIRGDGITFDCVDLDRAEELGSFDTVMLFSVLHHTQQVLRNAELIAKSCKRVIIECRLHEQGAKPVDGRWITTTAWSYEDVDHLIKGVSEFFPGFQLLNNHGQADRDRYVLELTRDGEAWSGSIFTEKERAKFIQVKEQPATISDEERQAKNKAENEALRLFLLHNTQRWAKIQPTRSDQCVIVELLVGHPGYFIANAVLAKYLQQIYGCNIKAILPNRKDVYMHALAESYGITDYYYEEDIGKLITKAQQLSMYEALQGSGSELRNALLELKVNDIRVGDLIYDMYLRNTGNVTVDRLDDQLLQSAISAIGYYQIYNSIYRANSVVATVVGHTVYTRFGILARVSVSHEVPVYAKKPSPLLVRKYTRPDELQENQRAVDAREFAYFWDVHHDHVVAKGKEHLSNQFNSNASSAGRSGMALWYSEAYEDSRKLYTRTEFCEAVGIDPKKPIVVLFSHTFPDAPHSFRSWLFDDYYQWLKQTLTHVIGIDRVNWVVKPHPDDKYYNSKVSAEMVYEAFASYSHIALAPADINNQSLFDFTHAIVTVTGTAGIEFASQGIPVILAGQAHYSGHGFTHEPKSLADYYQLLSDVADLSRLSPSVVDRVYALVAIQFYCMRVPCVYMPEMPLTPWESYDRTEVWLQASDRVARYEFGEDPFFQSVLVQVAVDAKHAIRYEYHVSGDFRPDFIAV